MCNEDIIQDLSFYPIKIGDYTCNVNRKNENLFLLYHFGDTEPKYSDEYGPHIELYSKNLKDSTIVPLGAHVVTGMLIENARELSDEEYYKTFVDKKKDFVENYLIKKTYAQGFESPTPVQSLCIPELIQRKDTLIQFKSGTGKTQGFLFGCLWGFDPLDKCLQYIFITSSHEVALQIYNQAKFLLPEKTKIALCIGHKKNAKSGDFRNSNVRTIIGTSSLITRPKSIKEEKEEINQAQVVVCTMGKFYDCFINRKWMDTRYLKAICIDEFDNIVSSRSRSSSIQNTSDQIRFIMKKIPEQAQRVFFSATVTQDALHIAHSYFRKYNPKIGEPLIVLLDISDSTLEGISQYYVECRSLPEKKEVLLDIIRQCRISQAIIFVNRIETANEIKSYLDDQEVPISSSVFHGELGEIVRKQVHKDFLENKIRMLISTDVTARGFDVQGINVVINLDMPNEFETYVHRIGRSGRYGRKGVAISLILRNNKCDERLKIEKINERSSKSQIKRLPNNLENLL